MKKKNALLILYCIPWIFVTLYVDRTCSAAWQYGLVLCLMAVGAGVMADRGKLLLLGNLLSFSSSLLMVPLFGYDAMNDYFKPFGAYGWVAALTAVSGIMQMLVWKKNQPNDR